MDIQELDYDVKKIVKPKIWDTYFYVNYSLRKTYEKIFHEFLNDKSPLSLLDFGCGVKPYQFILNKYCNKYIGIDVVENPKADIIIDPDTKLPVGDDEFDIVLSSQVLEHVNNVSQYLNECYRILKKDGILFISTHGTWQYHSSPVDVQRWTSYGLKNLIERHNFKIKKFVPVLGQLALTSQLRLTFYDSFANMIGIVGKILLIPISFCYQIKMFLEDFITPQRVKDRDSAVFIVVAIKK